ncbi:hypothetical protein D3C79_1027920 [compost metagenome]
MSTGRFTVIFTWNSIMLSSGLMNGLVAAEERQALFIQAQAQARCFRHVQFKIAIHQRFAENVFGQQ